MKRYEIYKHIGNLFPLNNGWIKELNLISWDNKEPVYDIRTWNSEHTEYGKGVSITAGQMVVLKICLMKCQYSDFHQDDFYSYIANTTAPRNKITGCSPILLRAACIYFPIL